MSTRIVLLGRLGVERMGRPVGDAAGWGWHADPYSSPPSARIDLLTAIAHELGHMFGLDHEGEGVMDEALAPGERALPELAPTTVSRAPAHRHPGAPSACSASKLRVDLKPLYALRTFKPVSRRVSQARAHPTQAPHIPVG